jgi:hypothetical protein
MVIDPAIETHYDTGYERSRLFPGGWPSLEFVRSMELLERLLPAPPARVLDVGGGPSAYAAQTRGGASTSCSPRAPPRPSPRSSASALTSSRPQSSRRRTAEPHDHVVGRLARPARH